MGKQILSFALALALLGPIPAFGNDLRSEIATPPKPIRLLKVGHLPRAHWYSIKPGKAYWLYAVEGGGEIVSYEEIIGVPDTRDESERNCVARLFTNTMQWGIPLLISAGVTLIGVKR